ncbi:MAG: hypothetical protein A2X12_03895 [Bacteroidetes bacterium GWE2_29_8]|nr:MAG: hypothetical protein A2X12_03895 [Bacteroidetes bacterium GWE2_29_8]
MEALSKNYLANETKLYIYSDGVKNNSSYQDEKKIEEVRCVIKSKQWCREVEIIERDSNKGLDASIIEGVSNIINIHKKVIVLEDDIVTSKHFLSFMNECLNVYKDSKNILTISGYIFPVKYNKLDTVLLPLTSAWGWATWEDRWQEYDHSISMKEIINKSECLSKRFNIGDFKYTNILMKEGEHWDIRWYYNLFMRNRLGVFPSKSLVKNIGFDGSGTNCNNNSDILNDNFVDTKIEIIKKNYIDLEFYALLHNYFRKEVERNIFKKIKNKIRGLNK